MKSVKSAYVLMFPRYFRYSIGSTGRIHRDGRRQKHYQFLFTSVVNKSFFVKELEKGKKRKEKEIKHVVGREGDESCDVKIKEKWFGKQNRKEDEPCGKENENKHKQKSGENNNEKIK